MERTGKCLCGRIQYRTEEEPIWAAHCHCGMCRRVSGAPFMSLVQFPEGKVEWTNEKPADYESSEGIHRAFCPHCGSSLTFESNGFFYVTLGTLDDPNDIEIESHVFTKNKLNCIMMADGLPEYVANRGGKGGKDLP